MNWNGKIVGLTIGLFLGPFGVIIGLFLGHLFDIGFFNTYLRRYGFLQQAQEQASQQIFFDATFAIMGYIAKCDGRVSEQEIQTTRQIMSQLGIHASKKERAIKQFYSGTHSDFDLAHTLTQLRQASSRYPSLLRTFIEIQIQMANAEGVISLQKRAAIQSICEKLGIHGFNFYAYEQQSRAEQNYQRYYSHSRQEQSRSYTSNNQLDDAYKILGVSKETSKEDVKKAYRRLMSKHHPDKLIAKGLPPDMIKLATQKTQQIKKAYDTILGAMP